MLCSGNAMTDALLTTTEVAALLRVHPKHVYRLLRRGLPARRVGAEWRFSRRDVLAWSGAAPETDGARPPREAPALADAPSLVAANGDVALLLLLRLAGERGPPLLGLVPADTRTAAELLRTRAVLAAGAHAGGFPTHVGDERVARIHLVRRDVGLVFRPADAGKDLRALARGRIASRPRSAGVRGHLDAALRKARLDPARVHRRAVELPSHLDVVLAVASGRADAGVASRAWAARAGLGFRAIAAEDYGLIVKARDLGDPRVVRLCEVAQGAGYREQAGAVPGYDVAGSGDVRYDA